MKLRKRKRLIPRTRRSDLNRFCEEMRLWDESAPVGREFGSHDFDRLMAEDHRLLRGVFDPCIGALDADRFAAFQALVDEPPAPTERLRRTLEARKPWEDA